jgi:hypothetical protein
MEDKKILYSTNGIWTTCGGWEWDFAKQKEFCTVAEKASHANRCMYLGENRHCDWILIYKKKETQ